MNVVIYARFSSSSQREESIEGQVRVCQKYAEENGYTIINTYSDRAISGKTDSRPALQKMLTDSSKKQFQAVLVYSLDRFGRNLMQSVINECKLEKNDVKLLSATEKFEDNAAGNLQRNILKSFAQYYSEELSEKVIRGMNLNAEKCLSTGGNIALGFRVGEDKKFHINKEEALIVRYIFESYANGMTIKEITDNLNAQGFKTSRGAKFNKNSLRTLLQNKRYIGIYTYKGTETPNGMPRIIPDELFYKVADILEKNKKAPARAKADVEYLLTLKLFCGHCKKMMTGISGTGKMGKTYRYYECKGRRDKTCAKKRVRKEYIEDLVVEVCRQQLTDKNIKKIANELMAIANTSAESHRIAALKKQIKEYERKRNNLLNNVAECDIPSVCKSIFVKIEEVENVLKTLEENLENETRNQSVISEPQIRFFLNSLKKGNTSDIKYRKALITMFVNTIYLYDDKMTLVFNSGDDPVTIDDFLLSEIEENFQHMEKGLFLDKVSPPAIEERVFCTLFFCYIILTNTFVYCIIVTLKKIFNKSEEKMKFKLTAVLTAAALSLTMVPFVVTSTASAETPTVLVLGDSISTGYGLSDTDNSYASLVADYYGATYINYAQDGLKAEELKVSLENGTYDTELSKADYVLVTIGGNDIIAPALEIIQNVTKKYGYNVDDYTSVKELISTFSSKDQAMVDEVIDELANTISTRTISKNYVAPCFDYVSKHTNGKIVFQTVYNPFSINTSSSEWAPYKSRLDNINAKMDIYCSGMKKYYEKYVEDYSNIQLLDAYSHFAGHGETLTNIESIDIHPNQAGHLYLAADTISLLGGNSGDSDKLQASYNSIAEPYRSNLAEISDAKTKLANLGVDLNAEPVTTEPVTTTTYATKPTTITTVSTIATSATTVTTKPTENKSLGDVNNDGEVDSKDAVNVLKDYASFLTSNKYSLDMDKADINGDGKIDSKDAVLILKYYAEKLASGSSISMADYVKDIKK